MKNEKRKIVILVLVAIVVIIAALILIISLAGKKTELKSDDMPTKAYYKIKGNSINVVLKKPADRKHEWNAVCDKEGAVKIDNRSTIGKNVYFISAVSKTKSVDVAFELVGKEDHKDIIYRIVLSLYCDKNGKVTVEGATYIKLNGITYGNVGDKKFSIITNEEGEIYVYIDGDETWDYVKTDDTISVSGPISLENMSEFIIVNEGPNEDGKTAEKAVKTLYSDELSKKIDIDINVEKDGKLNFVNFTVSDYAPEKIIDEAEQKEFTEKYGTVKLPAKAVRISYADKQAYASAKDNVGFTVHQVEYYLDDVKCEYGFTNEAKDEYDLIWKLMGAEGLKQLNEVINKQKVNIMIIGEKYSVATWNDGDNVHELFIYKGDENLIKSVLKEII